VGLMSIHAYIQRQCRHTAVYWGNPQSDGYGGYTYDDPVEISCFWMGESDVAKDEKGNEIVTKAKVYVLQDIDEQGYLWKGKLADLTATQKSDPKQVDEAMPIIRFIKTPSLRIDEYIRKALIGVTSKSGSTV